MSTVGLDSLETLFGDPFNDGNPVGFAGILAADEQAAPLGEGELLLDKWNFNHEFVPRSLGGRWTGSDELARRLRPVFRRDPALGLGYGVTSLMAAVNVWAAGSAAQRRKVADHLLAGKRIAVAFHELAHGNDFLRNEFAARITTDQILLSGTKQVINNVERAESLVLFARTADAPGPRAHSTLLIDKRNLPEDSVRYLPRFTTSGMRGCHLGGIVFDNSAVGFDALVGAPGQGVETALRAFQITRATLPGMAIGLLDSSLHLAHDFATNRRLYGCTVADLPHARGTLATAFTDLLIADCLATAVCRGLHLAPRASSTPAAAVKYLVPLLLEEAHHELSVILGARSYLREGRHAAFGKFSRDLPLVSIGHAGATSCLLTVLAQLPTLAKRSWSPAPPPAELFDTAIALPELDVSGLSVTDKAPDPLMSTLAQIPPDDDLPGFFAAALAELRADSLRLPPWELGPAASAEAFELAKRYTILLAAAACLGTRQFATSEFLSSPQWLTAALTRLAARLGYGDGVLADELAEPLFDELTTRVDQRLSCGLDRSPIFG
ncbi:acyl-CoA dehydrogenase [Streptomyces sp. BK340]|uniref:acyl-CoA dehydrogenase n=1 Tax=Streptomyces sp. BK340 TaxID=2572903 RepID=UPI0011A0E3A8|nr:acyl-CoA dehydrogenase [Streptomyces sp. BK340]TVZ75507.1 alkylation response protein AidB-like acyl-CoA dehydrogenase [Streptomyces sp. BK340]